MSINTNFSIDRLNLAQMNTFVENISVKTPPSGEKIFSATIDFYGENQEIVATTKEIFNKLEKLRISPGSDIGEYVKILEKFIAIG